MEASALRYSGGVARHGRSPLLRLQSDERLIAVIRRGNATAFEVLVSRYQSRLLAFCRHLLGSREDAEDVLQEVLAAAFNAILADDRPINVRPWLYRIARNRSLNHLRRIQPIGVDSMDIHLSEHGASAADKVHDREQFRLLVGDIHELPETQRTALVLREMDALSYEQIAEAMDTTVPGVKSLLVRARISLAEASESRLLSCDDVRMQLAEVAEGLRRRPDSLVRRHTRSCRRCSRFQGQLKQTNKALAALLPLGPMALLRKSLLFHIGHSAGTGSGASATAGATSAGATAGATATAGGTVGAGATAAPAAFAGAAGTSGAVGSAGGFISAGAGAIATKAAATVAAAAIVTAGAVEASPSKHRAQTPIAAAQSVYQQRSVVNPTPAAFMPAHVPDKRYAAPRHASKTGKHAKTSAAALAAKTAGKHPAKATDPGRTTTQTVPTVLPSTASGQTPQTATTSTDPTTGTGTAATGGVGIGPATPPAGSSTGISTTTPPATTTDPSTTAPTASTDPTSTTTTSDPSTTGTASGHGAPAGTTTASSSDTSTTAVTLTLVGRRHPLHANWHGFLDRWRVVG